MLLAKSKAGQKHTLEGHHSQNESFFSYLDLQNKYLNVPETNQTMLLSKMANCFATCDLFNRKGGARLCSWGVLLFLRVRPGLWQLFTREWGEVNSYRRRRGGGRHQTTEWTYPHSGHKGLTWAMVRYNPFTFHLKDYFFQKMSCPCETFSLSLAYII